MKIGCMGKVKGREKGMKKEEIKRVERGEGQRGFPL